MKKFLSFFSGKHLFANIFTIMILLVGINSTMNIKKDLLPDISLPVVTIQTVYPKASPEDVEINVTNKIEKSLKTVSGIKDITSYSIENISSVTVALDSSLDSKQVETVIQDIRDAIGSLDNLPSDIQGQPVISRRNTGDRPIIVAGIYSSDENYSDLRQYAIQLEKKIRRIPGVSKIEKTGYRDREIRIELDPAKVKRYELDVMEVVRAVQKRNVRGTAGAMETFACDQDIVTLSQFKNPTDVEDVVVRSTADGPLIRVSNFGKVKDTFKDEDIYTRINGKKVIALNIYKNSSADIVDTVNYVKKFVENEKNINPGKFGIILSNDYSRYVNASYKVVMINGIAGFLLVILVLTLFLNFRASIWVAMGIPVSLLGSIAILNLTGYSLNVISLSALILVIGIIVDDAIIISESIFREYELGKPPKEAAVEGVSKVIFPVITTLATTIAAFSPMLFIPGDLGKFIFVIPFIIIVSLITSLLEGIIALPSHINKSIMKHEPSHKKDQIFNKVRIKYEKFLSALLNKRKYVIPSFILLLIMIFGLASKFITFSAFPDDGAESMAINLEAAQGCGLSITEEQILKIEKAIKEIPENEITSFVTTLGKQEKSLPKKNYGYITINLTPFSSRTRTADEIANELREKISSIENLGKVTFDIKGPGPSPSKAVEFTLSGSDDIKRKAVSNKLFEKLSALEGVIEPERDDIAGKAQMHIEFDYDKMSRYAVDVNDVLRELRIAYDGEVITSIQYGEEEIDYRLTYASSKKKDINFLKNLYISNQFNKPVQLKQIASFKTEFGLDGYRHYNGERSVTITANIDENITTSNEIDNIILETYKSLDHDSLSLLIQGKAQSQQESNSAFGRTFIIALLSIYLLLSLLFNSVKWPLIVLSAIPFGVAGVFTAFMIHNQPVTFMGMLGIIGLVGVIVNDSLVMIDRLLQEKYNGLDRKNILLKVASASSERLRAVVITTITTAAGVLPLAYGLGGEDAVNAPMALALGWGLIFGTIVTLIFVPVLFSLIISREVSKNK